MKEGLRRAFETANAFARPARRGLTPMSSNSDDEVFQPSDVPSATGTCSVVERRASTKIYFPIDR